ncbi:MAG: diguanylate cyclase [Deltaproteobacteria bacterium]|nr:diguanylate cyclase [Deltaproteobacteria bacterium]
MSNASILIVDPESSHRDDLATTLNTQGFNVTSATSGVNAINALTAYEPDLIILDEEVNDLTPIDLAKRLQAQNMESFIIVMSRQGDLDRSMKWIMSGALTCLKKPVEYEKLRPAIEMGLDNKKAFYEILRLTDDLRESNQKLEKNQELFLNEQAALREKSEQLRFLNRLSTDLSSSLETGAVIKVAMNALSILMKPDLIFIAASFAPHEKLGYYTNRQIEPEVMNMITQRIKPELTGSHSACQAETRIIEGVETVPPLLKFPRHMMAYPLFAAGAKHGLLTIHYSDKLRATADQSLLLENVSMLLAQALLNAHQHGQALYMASRDPLTGLYNRRSFEESLAREFERTQRYNRPMSLIMADLDNFKTINDRFGHPAGDFVIKTVAQALENCLRTTDIPVRYGGEEFAVILPDTGLDQASHIARRIRGDIKKLNITLDGTVIHQTISLGMTDTNNPGVRQAQDLVQLADKALYKAKIQGRDTVRSCP